MAVIRSTKDGRWSEAMSATTLSTTGALILHKVVLPPLSVSSATVCSAITCSYAVGASATGCVGVAGRSKLKIGAHTLTVEPVGYTEAVDSTHHYPKGL